MYFHKRNLEAKSDLEIMFLKIFKYQYLHGSRSEAKTYDFLLNTTQSFKAFLKHSVKSLCAD